MSEIEKKVLEALGESISQMSDFEKGYILGMAETKASEKKEEIKSEDREDNC